MASCRNCADGSNVMNRIAASLLALGLAAATGSASAQSYFNGNGDRYDRNTASGTYGQQPVYDYARVLRVRPVIDDGRAYPASSQQQCYQRRESYAGDYRNDDDYYRNDRYQRDDYNRDYGRGGTSTGRTVATVVGGIVGAAIGSQVGGGSARYATSAIGSMVGGIAGQKVYENSVRNRYPAGSSVTVCDPLPDDRGYDRGYDRYGTSGNGVTAYDVTYEYAGREYTTRTQYHPGDRIRVLVDVRPQ